MRKLTALFLVPATMLAAGAASSARPRLIKNRTPRVSAPMDCAASPGRMCLCCESAALLAGVESNYNTTEVFV